MVPVLKCEKGSRRFENWECSSELWVGRPPIAGSPRCCWQQCGGKTRGVEQGWEQAGPDVTLSQSVTLPRSRSPPFRYTALIVIFPQIFTSDDPYVLRCEIQDKFRTVTIPTSRWADLNYVKPQPHPPLFWTAHHPIRICKFVLGRGEHGVLYKRFDALRL